MASLRPRGRLLVAKSCLHPNASVEVPRIANTTVQHTNTVSLPLPLLPLTLILPLPPSLPRHCAGYRLSGLAVDGRALPPAGLHAAGRVVLAAHEDRLCGAVDRTGGGGTGEEQTGQPGRLIERHYLWASGSVCW